MICSLGDPTSLRRPVHTVYNIYVICIYIHTYICIYIQWAHVHIGYIYDCIHTYMDIHIYICIYFLKYNVFHDLYMSIPFPYVFNTCGFFPYVVLRLYMYMCVCVYNMYMCIDMCICMEYVYMYRIYMRLYMYILL